MSDATGSEQGEQGDHAHLFLVTLWQEQSGKEIVWYGKVQHVVTGRTRLLKTCAQLHDLAGLSHPEADSTYPGKT